MPDLNLDPSNAATDTSQGNITPDSIGDFSALMQRMQGGSDPTQAAPQTNPMKALTDKYLSATQGSNLAEAYGFKDKDGNNTSLLKKLGMTGFQMANLLSGGLLGLPGQQVNANLAKKAAAATSAEKNFLTEEKNAQLLQVAQQKIAEADALRKDKLGLQTTANQTKKQLADILQQNADTKTEQVKSVERVKTEANAIKRLQEQANAGNMQAKVDLGQRLATLKERGISDKPEDVARELSLDSDGKLDPSKYLQNFSDIMHAESMKNRPVNLGGTTSTSHGVDANGNPTTATSRANNFGQLTQGGIMPITVPAQNRFGGNVTPVPQGQAAPPANAAPLNAAQALGIPHSPVAPTSGAPDWTTPHFSPNIATQKDQRKDVDTLTKSITPMRMQQENLENAIISGDAKRYTGIIQGNDLANKARATFGNVGPNEALSKPLDYGALVGSMSSVKGSWKNSELQRAGQSLGQKIEDPFNQLATHGSNVLMREVTLADRNGTLKANGVTPQEAVEAAKTALSNYLKQVGEVSSLAKTDPRRALTPAPKLPTIQEAIDNARMKKKLQSVGVGGNKLPTSTPGNIQDLSTEELLRIAHGK